MKLSETIVVTNSKGKKISPQVTNCIYSDAIETIIASGWKTKIEYYTVKVKNYEEFTGFIKDKLKKVSIEGESYEQFSITPIEKDTFKITIRI